LDKEILIAQIKDCMINTAKSGISQLAYTRFEMAALMAIEELKELPEGVETNANG
jgi:hypothetical protein